jgi:hypothetical protein
MLIAVTQKNEISKCQKKIESSLKKALINREYLRIGHPGGSFENDVYYGEGLWYSYQFLDEDDVAIPRHWNGFGLGLREDGNQIIIVEINPPIQGLTKQIQGLFAKSEHTGSYYLLHRGRIGGGRKGIGKSAFEAWYRGLWVKVYHKDGVVDEAILVAEMESEDFIEQIRHFVVEVDQFKKEITTGSLSRSPQTDDKNLKFDPEFYGEKNVKRASTIQYETFHGLVVNTLEKRLRAAGKYDDATIFNTRLIDLGIQKNGKTRHIFEVKSSSDRQAIYTGIGQLMFHTLGNPNIKKTLVLPLDKYRSRLINIFNQLGIDILKYEIKKGQVKFMT